MRFSDLPPLHLPTASNHNWMAEWRREEALRYVMYSPLWSFSYSISQCPHMYFESSGYMGGLRGLMGYMSNPPEKRRVRRSKVGGKGEGRER